MKKLLFVGILLTLGLLVGIVISEIDINKEENSKIVYNKGDVVTVCEHDWQLGDNISEIVSTCNKTKKVIHGETR